MHQTAEVLKEAPAVQDRTKWFGLAIILAAAFMDLADVTIVNVALPYISADLSPSPAGLQWITGGYSVTFAATMIIGGRLGDIYGRKRVFIVGIAIFTLSSLLAGLAPDAGLLIGARVVQGMGAGLMVPQVLSIINVTFEKEERAKAFGMYGATIGLATVLGQLIGATLIELDIAGTDWRPIFLVNVFVGVLGFVLGMRFLEESTNQGSQGLDVLGATGFAATLFLLLFPITVGREEGWPVWCWLMMALAVVVGAAAVYRQIAFERVGKTPLISPRIFKQRSTSGGFAVQIFFATASGMFFLTWTMYMQTGLSWSPIRAATTGLAFAIAAAISSWLAIQILAPKLGRGTLFIGTALMLAGAVLFLVLTEETDMSSTIMVAPLVVMGLGMGTIVSPLADLVLTEVDSEDAGSVSGVFNTLNQVGLAVGIALTSFAFFAVLDNHAKDSLNSSYTSAFQTSLLWIIVLLIIVMLVVPIIPSRLRLTTDPWNNNLETKEKTGS
ncbi:MFS transporter [Rhodococcus marinonascens]|uniref:MFS transporter n=1 Tax=Rhodococcus marinonascens TaxID=38311 RepID=UPI0009FE48BE|nr:MFS transporter [Rhodococcus marinonascens]